MMYEVNLFSHCIDYNHRTQTGECYITHNTCNIIRIYYECKGRIENSVPRIAVWHHEASRVMTNGDPEGLSSLSDPHTNNGFFLLLAIVFIYLF